MNFRHPCSLRSQTLFKCLLCLYEVEYREDKDLVCKPLTLLCHKPGAAPRFATLLTYILWDKKELTGSWSRPSLRLEANWHFPWIIANQTSLLSHLKTKIGLLSYFLIHGMDSTIRAKRALLFKKSLKTILRERSELGLLLHSDSGVSKNSINCDLSKIVQNVRKWTKSVKAKHFGVSFLLDSQKYKNQKW